MDEIGKGPQTHPPPHTRPTGAPTSRWERLIFEWTFYFTEKWQRRTNSAPIAPGAMIQDLCKGPQDQESPIKLKFLFAFYVQQRLVVAESQILLQGCWK